MKTTFLKSWKSENIVFTSKKSLHELEDCIKDYIKEKENLSLIDKISDFNNLRIHLTTKHDIEVQFYFQLLTFPGYGMTAEMIGKIIKEEKKTKVTTTIRINTFLKMTLLIIPFFLLSISLINEFDFFNLLISIILSLLYVLAFLLYLKKYKEKLVKVFKTSFKLE